VPAPDGTLPPYIRAYGPDAAIRNANRTAPDAERALDGARVTLRIYP
jgi:hypothetical protein